MSGKKKITIVHRDFLLNDLDGETPAKLIEFFKEAEEDYGPDVVLDYYRDEEDNEIELRLITIREETDEEEQLRLAVEEKVRTDAKQTRLKEAEQELRNAQRKLEIAKQIP